MRSCFCFSGCENITGVNAISEPNARAATGTAQAPIANSGPDFLGIGAQKAGTSWLYEQLWAHPDFWMPPVKGLHYFNRPTRQERITARPIRLEQRRNAKRRMTARDERDLRFIDAMEALYARAEIDWSGYAQLFALKGSLLSGDVTPAYSTLEDKMIDSIVANFPRVKAIFLARDPVERAWSQLSLMMRHRTIDAFDATDFSEVKSKLLLPDVQLRSYPSQIVSRWRRHLPPSQFRVYFFDDLQNDPAALRHSIIEFLGGDPQKPSGDVPAEQNSKATQEKLKLTPDVQDRLAAFFEEELKACARELAGPAAEWPRRYKL
jgi:Sulfotransferase family